MAPKSYFLGGLDMVDVAPARVGGRDTIDTYADLIEEVRARCGADAASLFAEPVKGTNRTTGVRNIAWYCDIEGTPFLLRQLDPTARQTVVELLRQRLAAFASILGDSRHGAVLGSWLYVLSPDGILAVSGQPVIKNWGLVPAEIAASDEARDTHYRNTIGLYVPNVPTPPFGESEEQSFAGRMARFAERETARAAPPAPPPPEPPPAPSAPVPPPHAAIVPVAVARRSWLAPAIACAVGAVVLAILLFGHVLLYPVRQAGSDDQAIAAQEATNKALRERLEQLRRAGARVCEAPGGTHPVNDPALLPPSPSRTQVPTLEPGKSQPQVGSLASLLEKATVLVLAGDSLGSGYFISDHQVITNHHVVGDMTDVKLGNKAIGHLLPGHVVATGSGQDRGTQDIALIEVAPQPNVSFLRIAVTPDQLTQVTAAGFPGAIVDSVDTHVLEANFTQGVVTSRQMQPPGDIETIIHTAQIGHGNSGGPLVDSGGCLVGMNSWIAADEEDHVIYGTFFEALDVSEIRKFLDQHHVAFASSPKPCAPLTGPVVAAGPPAPAPAPAAR